METKPFKEGDVTGTAKIVYGGRAKPVPMEDDREPQEIELERLEREVIEAAKRERAVFVAPIENVNRWTRDLSTAQTDLRKAVGALIKFESSQQQIQK